MPVRTLSVAALVTLASCTDVANAPVTDPTTTLDETVFRCDVQPILARQCSYTACHGQAGTALRVYTPGKLRQTPPANIDDMTAPLTDAEQHANFQSAAGFATGGVTPDQNWLLRKPLPQSDGGFEHVGGAIYASTSDAQYQAILGWLAGTGSCSGATP